MTVRTRFAPSPTGALHIGGARTALFNWLYAKSQKGQFLLRIEDTDRARSTDDNVDIILDSLKWLGITMDEEPVYQFSRAQRHAEIAKELVEKGKAYYCYTTPEELQQMREEAEKKGEHFKYPKTWRDKSPEEAPTGIDPVVRIKAPLEGESTVQDAVQGAVNVQNKELDDFIILRSDGTPTYLLSVVVDDHDMDIGHVIRGDDHLTNTFRQKIIFDAMGWQTPIFAHVPLIHGPDGKKMSKRHGATGVDDYKQMGILPEALCNYLLRLGWGHGDEEIIPLERAIELFDLDGIGRAPARFDLDKLKAFNAHYIKERPNDELAALVCPILGEKVMLPDCSKIWILKGMDDLKERAKDLNELADTAAIYATKRPVQYDEKAAELLSPEALDILKKLHQRLEHIEQFDTEHIDALCKRFSEENDIKMKDIMMPLRAAVTGTTKSPHLAKMMEIMGKDEILNRIADAFAA